MLSSFAKKPVRKPVSIRRNVLRLSLPVLLSSLFLRLVSIVDVFLTGSLRGTGDTFYVFIVTLVAVWGVFLIDWYFRGAAFAWRYHRRDLHGIVL